MAFVQTVLAFVLALAVLVTIHEYGHFWVARRIGVKVLRFSIGFGVPLLRWRDRHGTEFWLASIPLGGYVKLLDAREAVVSEQQRDQEFSGKPVMQRLAVYAAGPAVNLLFAVLVYWAIFVNGVQVVAPVVGHVAAHSIAAKHGVLPGYEIVAVDGSNTQDWEAVTLALVRRIGDSGYTELRLRPHADLNDQLFANNDIALSLPIDNFLGGDAAVSPLEQLGITPYRPSMPAVIAKVLPDGAGERAGLQAGDEIISADQQAIVDWQAWVDYVRVRADVAIDLSVKRAGYDELVRVQITPEPHRVQGEAIGRVGVVAVAPKWPDTLFRTVEYSLLSGLQAAVDKTWGLVMIILKTLGKMLTGDVSVENLSGPITIAKVAGDRASYGLEPFMGFLAYLSISLGVLNLLPIPMLDGGHILYALVEVVRGKPLSDRVQQAGVGIGIGLLAMFMMLAFYNDIVRLTQ